MRQFSLDCRRFAASSLQKGWNADHFNSIEQSAKFSTFHWIFAFQKLWNDCFASRHTSDDDSPKTFNRWPATPVNIWSSHLKYLSATCGQAKKNLILPTITNFLVEVTGIFFPTLLTMAQRNEQWGNLKEQRKKMWTRMRGREEKKVH